MKNEKGDSINNTDKKHFLNIFFLNWQHGFGWIETGSQQFFLFCNNICCYLKKVFQTIPNNISEIEKNCIFKMLFRNLTTSVIHIWYTIYHFYSQNVVIFHFYSQMLSSFIFIQKCCDLSFLFTKCCDLSFLFTEVVIFHHFITDVEIFHFCSQMLLSYKTTFWKFNFSQFQKCCLG